MVVIDQFLEELCPLNLAILRDFTVFSSPELKTQVSFSDHPLSGVHL
jgi:hypothetical protein